MPIDFNKLTGGSLLEKEINPREIFNLLPDKHERYEYPRDVQSHVWDGWLERRSQSDVVIKMNTGGGKTVVGLILLKSCLNEGVGPAVYICPDNYLVSQVEREARELGIEATTDLGSSAFLQGKAIFVGNIHRLINGKSAFGTTYTGGKKISIGSILIDDAHACLATTETQFTLNLGSEEPAYAELLHLFEDDLRQQSQTTFLDIENGEADHELMVPFWAWTAKAVEVATILNKHRAVDSVQFNWRLIQGHAELCRCIFSGSRVEISPICLPIEAIPSFVAAKRRIFMTATLADDSILVSHFNAKPEHVINHITPKVANDIGERMILFPQEIDPGIKDDDLRDYLKKKSKHFNVVVIVPSKIRAQYWAEHANRIGEAENLSLVVRDLKAGHVGLVVLINKYDGVDLPENACRILVLDGLPRARTLYDRVESNLLEGSQQSIGRQIQRIEQGMGRGIRSNDDYCVVLLMGASLTKTVFLIGAKEMFSPATRAQLDLSDQISKDLSTGIAELDSAINYCLERNKDWRRVAREAVANVAYESVGRVRPVAVAQRKAFDQAAIRSYSNSQKILQELINELSDTEEPAVLGWLKWQLSEYVQFGDAVQAQQILKAAVQINRRLTKPLDGIEYEKLQAKNWHQAQSIVWKLKPYTGQANLLLVQINGVLDELAFVPDNANEFETALQELSGFLGFGGQRPEKELSKGPDNLWAVGNLRYFVIECKSGAIANKVSKEYANQLSGSANWFLESYDHTTKCTPIMVHPTHIFEKSATPHPDARILNSTFLPLFKESVRQFIGAAAKKLDQLDVNQVQALLQHYKLTPDLILETFTAKPKN